MRRTAEYFQTMIMRYSIYRFHMKPLVTAVTSVAAFILILRILFQSVSVLIFNAYKVDPGGGQSMDSRG